MSGQRHRWVKFPTGWIQDGGLLAFRWAKGGGVNTAALIVLMVIAQNSDRETGLARLTYDDLETATDLSRGTIASALRRLRTRKLIAPAERRSVYALTEFGVDGRWAKLPARPLYLGNAVPAFRHFNLRHPTQLNALKIYFFFVARRNNLTNQVNTTFERIADGTGVEKNRVRSALSFLASVGLIHIERSRRAGGDQMANAYRLTHIDPYNHPGTSDGTPHSVAAV